MVVVERSVLIHHGASRMRALVEDIESYPSFLPWCGAAEVVSGADNAMVATLTIDFRGIRQKFTTENAPGDDETIHMRLVSGPFRSLDGQWQFKALGPQACKVSLKISYEFSSRLLGAAVGPVFRHITSSLVESFVTRADTLYGARDPASDLPK